MNSIAQSTDTKMTKAERTELAQLVKLRAKLAKDDIEARSALKAGAMGGEVSDVENIGSI